MEQTRFANPFRGSKRSSTEGLYFFTDRRTMRGLYFFTKVRTIAAGLYFFEKRRTIGRILYEGVRRSCSI